MAYIAYSGTDFLPTASPELGTGKDPTVPTGLDNLGCCVLWRGPQVPRNLLNQHRMIESPDHQRLKLALGLRGCMMRTW